MAQDPAQPLNFTALATQTDGYSATDLRDLVGRAIHEAVVRTTSGHAVVLAPLTRLNEVDLQLPA